MKKISRTKILNFLFFIVLLGSLLFGVNLKVQANTYSNGSVYVNQLHENDVIGPKLAIYGTGFDFKVYIDDALVSSSSTWYIDEATYIVSSVVENDEKYTIYLVTPVVIPEEFKYIDENGVEHTSEDFNLVESSTTSWSGTNNESWYVVYGTVEVNERITVSGTVNLILADESELRANHGITTTGATLNIYAESDGENAGKLTATGDYGTAGIGGNLGESGGTLNIYGGIINATGGTQGAGIGGGTTGSMGNTNGGNITIYGGDITATGSDSGAGIGGGSWGESGQIVISGGKVAAYGGTNSIAIGGGQGKNEQGASVTIDGRAMTLTSKTFVYPMIVDLNTISEDITVADGYTITGSISGDYKISIASDAVVTLKDATINSSKNAGISCDGNATIILKGNNSVKSSLDDYPGIFVNKYSTLTIQGDGSLTVTGAEYGSGIGGGFEIDCGTIVIESGTITATGGHGSPGIGSGMSAHCNGIEIKGGNIRAYGKYGAAGIGTGSDMSRCEYITISGGKVYAQGADYEYSEEFGGAGIGVGVSGSYWADSSCEDITITGGNIEAKGGANAAAIGAGSGYYLYFDDTLDEEDRIIRSYCGTITITDGVGRIYAVKGKNSPQTIGGGKYSEIVWGINVLGGGVITESPYLYLSEGPSGVIVLIDDIPNPVVASSACKTAIEAARAAYDKLANDDQKALVTNYSVLVAAEKVFAVINTNALINALPAVDDITIDDKDAIEAARAAYDALDDDQKSEIDDATVTKLTNAEAKFAVVKEADDTLKANAVKEKIAAIGTVEYSDESKAKIDEARDAYDALTDDQKAKVDNYDTLTQAENTYLVRETKAIIEAIGTVEYTAECKAKIDAAVEAFEALSEELQDRVDNVNILIYAEQNYQILEVTALIDAIGTVAFNESSKAAIDAARAAYDGMAEKLQPDITNYSTLTAAEAAYATMLADHEAADAAKALIAAIGTVDYSSQCQNAITAARTAYDALTADQKALVDNLNTLTAAESTYATLKADHDAAEAVKSLIEAIGTVEYNSECESKIAEAKAAYEALTEEQKGLVENYNVLTEAEQTYNAKEAEAKKRKGPSAGVVILIILIVILVLSVGGFVLIYFLNRKGITHIAFVDKVVDTIRSKLFKNKAKDEEAHSGEENNSSEETQSDEENNSSEEAQPDEEEAPSDEENVSSEEPSKEE